MKALGRVLAIFGAICFLIAVTTCCRADNRLTLATQENFNANKGFYIDLENSAASYGTYEPLSALNLVLGVANGGSWQWITSAPSWTYGHSYHVQAVIAPSGSTLTLDGQSVGTASGAVTADSSDPLVA